MRLDTMVWIRCETKGRPADTIQEQLTIRDAVLRIAQWLAKVYMGSHIVIRIARTEAELHSASRKSRELDELSGELDKLLGGTPVDEWEESDVESA